MKYLVVLVLSLKITICDRIDDKVDLAMQYVQNIKKQIEKEEFLVKNNLMVQQPYKILQIVKDMKGWPEYVNNGEGPQYSEKDIERMKRNGSYVEPDYLPDMPQTTPDVLFQMKEYIERMEGIPRPANPYDMKLAEDYYKQYMINHTLQQQNRFERVFNQKKQGFIKNMPRFEELESEDKMKEQVKMFHSLWDTAKIIDAWASSVWSFKVFWFSRTYSANLALRYDSSYWCSAGNHKKTDVITWEGTLEQIQRIHHIFILWAYAPGEFKIEVSQDGKVWEEKQGWKQNKYTNYWWFKKFWFWRWIRRSYTELVDFEDPFFMKKFRILMKDDVNSFFGIYNVRVYVKAWLVMLISGETGGGDKCLSVKDGKMESGTDIVAMNCVDAIAASDNRELFVLQNNFHITSYQTGHCIEASYGDVSNNGKAKLVSCILAMFMFDSREKFFIDGENKMRTYRDRNKCIFYIGNELSGQYEKGVDIWASSSTVDCQHEIQQAVDGDDTSYWSTQPGVDHAVIKISLPSLTVKSINFIFQNKPVTMEVLIMQNGFWKSQGIQKIKSDDTQVQVGLKTLEGIKIILQGAQDTVDTANGKFPSIGLYTINIVTGQRTIGFRSCNDQSGNANWYITDNYWNSITPKDVYQKALKTLQDFNDKFIIIIRKTVQLPHFIVKLSQVAEQLKDSIKSIDDELFKLDKQVNLLGGKKEFDVKDEVKISKYIKLKGSQGNDKERVEKSKQVGATIKSAAESCYQIKQMYSYKKSGFYWLQNQCMKDPLRVFCDFDNHRVGKDVAYYGPTKSKTIKVNAKNRKDLVTLCADMGLEYYQFDSKQDYQVVKEYLIDIGVDLSEDKMIPAFFDYDCTFSCQGDWHSLQSKKTPPTPFAGSLLNQGNIFNMFFNFLFGVTPNTMGFGNDISGSLVKFELGGKLKVKGVLCGTNPSDAPTISEKDIKCEDILKGNDKIQQTFGSISVLKCPGNCDADEFVVYGSGKYSDLSNVCKAAIHAQAITKKGGKFQVKISQGIEADEIFESSFQNNIESKEKLGPSSVSFIVIKNEVICPQDDIEKARKIKEKQQSSFLQIEQVLTYKKKNKKNQVIDTTRVKDNNILLNDHSEDSREILLTQIKEYNHKQSEYKKRLNESINSIKDSEVSQDFIQFLQTSSTIQQDDGEGGGGGEKKEDEKEDDQNTQSTFNTVSGYLQFEQSDLSKSVHLVKDAIKLREDIMQQATPLLKSDLAPTVQLEKLGGIEKHILATVAEMDKLKNIGKQKLKQLTQIKNKLIDILANADKFSDYEQQYEFKSVYENWKILDMNNADSKPSKWDFATTELNGHKHGIRDISSINMQRDEGEGIISDIMSFFGIQKKTGNNFGTHLVLKGKAYYDFELNLCFMASNSNAFAIAFRYIDQFNYYAMEFKQGSYKRVVKMITGNYEIIKEVKDGGVQEAKWYIFKMEAKGDVFKFGVKEENKDMIDNDMAFSELEMDIDADDQMISQGTIALLNNGNSGLLFDNIKVFGRDCINRMDGDSAINFIDPKCFRLKEECQGSFLNQYEIIEKDEMDEPGEWKCEKGFDGAYGGIIQSGKPFYESSDQVGSMVNYKENKDWAEGVILFRFKAKAEEGYVGIAFHVKSRYEYYVFEISDKKCRLRFVNNNEYQIIEEVEGTICKYNPDKQHELMLERKGQAILIEMTKDDIQKKETVFEKTLEWKVQGGTVGFITFKTEAEFSQFQVMCLADYAKMKDSGEEAAENEKGAGDGANKGGKNDKNDDDANDGTGADAETDQPQDEENGGLNLNPGAKPKKKTCLDLKSKKQKRRFCAQKFLGDQEAIEYCMANYCDTCCTSLNPDDKSKKQVCVSKCGSKKQPERSMIWEQCIDPPNLKKNAFNVCIDLYPQDQAKQATCQLGQCSVCCSMVNPIYDIDVVDDDVKMCLQGCMVKFQVPEEDEDEKKS